MERMEKLAEAIKLSDAVTKMSFAYDGCPAVFDAVLAAAEAIKEAREAWGDEWPA